MNAFRARQQAKGRVDLLPPDPRPPAKRHARPFPARLETVDADFVVIRGGAARTSNDNRRPARTADIRPLSQHPLFRLAAGAARLFERGLQCLPGRAFAGLVGGAFLLVFAYAGGLSALREAFAAGAPRGALKVSAVTTLGDRNGMKVLSIYGTVDNRGGAAEALPPLTIRIEGDGTALQRHVALDAATLAPGGSEHFALHIPHGGGKVPKVSVSFAREDARSD